MPSKNKNPMLRIWGESQPWPKCKSGLTGVPFGRTELSIRLWTSKSGALQFGHGPVGCFPQWRSKGSSFGIIFWVFAWSDETRKNQMSQKWAPSIPKDAARLGGLGTRVFGPKFPKLGRKDRIRCFPGRWIFRISRVFP